MILLVQFLLIIWVTRPWGTTQIADQKESFSRPSALCDQQLSHPFGHYHQPGEQDKLRHLSVSFGHRRYIYLLHFYILRAKQL